MDTVATVLGSTVDAEEPLMDAGLDSLGAVELRNGLSKSVGMELPGTLMFDYPSVGALAGYLETQLAPAEAEEESEEESEEDDSSEYSSDYSSDYGYLTSREPQAPTIGIFSALCNGSAGDVTMSLDDRVAFDGVCTVPFSRWDSDADFVTGKIPGSQIVRFGGFMPDVDLWDMQAFAISFSEAIQLDPQQRLLMACASSALKQGAETMAAVRGENRSVTIGISSAEYLFELMKYTVDFTPYTSMHTLSVACGRVSYFFGFTGPSYSIDTACSSSLVAAHLANTLVKTAETVSSIALGTSMDVVAQTCVIFKVSGMLAPDGRCKCLDQAGDGYVRGESIGALEMKTVDEGGESEFLTVVPDTCINQDGRSSSLNAPNGPSQQSAIRTAMEKADVEAAQYEQLEMHGTGTSLGDPIEVGAATAVLTGPKTKRGALTLAAAKTAFGHAEAGAGLIGTLRAISSITHALVQSVVNLRTVNPYVADTMNIAKLASAPKQESVLVSHQMEELSVCGISSFAFQGTNAHCLLGRDVVETSTGYASAARKGFEQQSLWITPYAHPMISTATTKKTQVQINSFICGTTLAFLWDHRVNGKALLPGTGFLELSTAISTSVLGEAAISAAYAVSGVSIRFPLEMPDTYAVDKKDAMRGPHIAGALDLRSGSYDLLPGKSKSSSAYLTGKITQIKTSFNAVSASSRTAGIELLDGIIDSKCLLSRMLNLAGEQSGGRIQLGIYRMDGSGYKSHPAAMDNTLQVNAAKLLSRQSSNSRTRVPAAVGSFLVGGLSCRLQGWTGAHVDPLAHIDAPAVSYHSLQDAHRPSHVANLAGLEARVISRPVAKPAAVKEVRVNMLYVGEWFVTKAPTSTPAPRGNHLLVNSSAALQAAQAMCPAGSHFSGVEYFSDSSATSSGELVSHCTRLLQVIQSSGHLGVSDLHVQSLDAMQVGYAPTTSVQAIASSALHGIIRTTASECPTLAISVTDVASNKSFAVGTVNANIGGIGHVQRLLQSSDVIFGDVAQLRPAPRGSLNGLKVVPGMEPDQWDNHSGAYGGALNVHAVGVNFRDVLNVLGAYPGDPGPPGSDCAGVWAAHVLGVSGGEGAFGMAPGSLASVVCANMLMMPPKPSTLSFEAAATTPTVFSDCSDGSSAIDRANGSPGAWVCKKRESVSHE
jgi:acyl transferase domain-containing protein/acyl carrier protein